MGKKKEEDSQVPVIPLVNTWPGKIDDPELFKQVATAARQKVAELNQHVILNVRQVDWKHHAFTITLNKNLPIIGLKRYIASLMHQDSVYPQDIIIYNQFPETSIDYVQDADLPISTIPAIKAYEWKGEAPTVIGKPSATPIMTPGVEVYYDVLPYIKECLQDKYPTAQLTENSIQFDFHCPLLMRDI